MGQVLAFVYKDSSAEEESSLDISSGVNDTHSVSVMVKSSVDINLRNNIKICYRDGVKDFNLPLVLSDLEKRQIINLLTLLYNPDDLYLSSISPNFSDINSIKDFCIFMPEFSLDFKKCLEHIISQEGNISYRDKIKNIIKAFFPN